MSDLGIPDQVIANVMKDWGIGDGEVPAVEVENGEDAAGTPAEDAGAADYDPLADVGESSDAGPDPADTDGGPPSDDGAEDSAPPAPPGGPLWEEPAVPGLPPAAVTLPNGTTLEPDQLQALADLDRAIRAGQLPWQPPQPPAPSPTVPAAEPAPVLPPPPRLTEEDMEDPRAVATAMLWLAQKQQADLVAMRGQLEQTNAHMAQQRHMEAGEVTSSVMSLYKQRYNLPDDVMERIVATAAPISAPLFQMYMTGTDPRTGAKVVPDAAKAVETVLDMAYWNTPEARRFEIERQTAHQAKVRERKNQLGGVGGSSGSAPRQPKPLDLSNDADRHKAMVDEIAAAMGTGSE